MRYTQKMILWLEKKAQGKTFRELTRLFNNRFDTDVSYSQIKCVCGYYGIKTGYDWNRKITLPVGSEKIIFAKTGITYVKTSMLGNFGNNAGKWVSKQNILWEMKYGKIPKNHVIIFWDGNKNNFRMKNLFCVSRRIFFYMSTHNMFTNNPDITKTNYAIVKLHFTTHDAIKRVRGIKKIYPSKSKWYKTGCIGV